MDEFFESDWFKERPPAIQEAARFRPPGAYRLTTTNHVVHLRAYSENDDGSCTTCIVRIYADDNPGRTDTLMPREVFDINLTDLTPLD